jgi:hypothetical protein
MRSAFFRLVFASLILLAQGCAVAPRYDSLEASLSENHFEEAARDLEGSQSRYGKRSLLLYYFDRLWVEHLAGHYAASNELIDKADALISDLERQDLGAKEALSYFGNDLSLPYLGENYERVIMHVIGMLNDAALGDIPAALGQARRADQRQKEYLDAAGADKVVYAQDALASYLGGILYESQAGPHLQDAYADYQKADQAFARYSQAYGTPMPGLLADDLLRLSSGLGDRAAYQAYLKRFHRLGGSSLKELQSKHGEVLAVLYTGFAPLKVSEQIAVPVALPLGTQQFFSMAFPRFVPRKDDFGDAWIEDEDGRQAPFVLVEDLSSIAVQDLKDRVAFIREKAILRASAKFMAAQVIQVQAQRAGELPGLLAFLGTNIYGVASEQADTRSWRTLPGRIFLARMALSPGQHRLAFYLDQQAGEGGSELGSHIVNAVAGEKSFWIQSMH